MSKPQLRADQGWIFDNFLMLSENEDILHPGIMGTRLARGFMLEDLQAVYTKVTGRRSFPKAWQKRALSLHKASNASTSPFTSKKSVLRLSMPQCSLCVLPYTTPPITGV